MEKYSNCSYLITKDGKKVYYFEEDYDGMVGESQTSLVFISEGERVSLKSLKNILNQKDYKNMNKYQDEICESNYAESISYVI